MPHYTVSFAVWGLSEAESELVYNVISLHFAVTSSERILIFQQSARLTYLAIKTTFIVVVFSFFSSYFLFVLALVLRLD